MYNFGLIFFFIFDTVICAKILVILPIPVKSHHNLGKNLIEGLINKGHNVTYITPFESNFQQVYKNYNEIILDSYMKKYADNYNLFDFEKLPTFLIHAFENQFLHALSEAVFANKDVQNLLKQESKFDIVITETHRYDAVKYLAVHFNAHLIYLHTMGTTTLLNVKIGNPSVPAYHSELITYNSHKTFWERLNNFLLHIFIRLNLEIVYYPNQNKVLKKYFPEAPTVEEINRNVSLVLLNSHISTNQAVPFIPCMIDIGGFHIKPPKKLPTDLQTYFDKAINGVIYFSLGTILQSKHLSEVRRQIISNELEKRKENVLWKWENHTATQHTSNIMFREWLPQQDILGHPNIKLFISHGGLSSTMESIYHGIPMLVLPHTSDQLSNAALIEKEGFGLALKFSELNEQTFGDKLDELLENQKYRENARRMSRIFHDQPQKPLDKALYWIEYVLRHDGARHLRVAALELNWYQNASLDVIAFLSIVFLATIYSIYLLIKYVFLKTYKYKKD